MATVSLPTTMKAVRWTSSSGGIQAHFQVVDIPLPSQANSLPPDSTLVKVAYSSVNPVDYKFPETPLMGRFLNRIPCSDFSGTVVATTLPHLKLDMRVFGMTTLPAFGALAEYIIIKADQGIVPVPDGVRLQDTAALGIAGLIAYQCVAPYVSTGSRILINGGSGGVGTFAIQIAKALGCSVTATCSGPNVELCKSLGADEVIDYRSTDVVEHLKRSGVQYDHLCDVAFTPALFWSAQHYLKPAGVYTIIPGGPDPAALKMLLLPGALGGGQRKVELVKRRLNATYYAQIAEWMQKGLLKTVIEQEYGLEEVGEAFARLKSGHVRGKLVIKVAGDDQRKRVLESLRYPSSCSFCTRDGVK